VIDFTNGSNGVHIHLDGANHTPTSIRNFINYPDVLVIPKLLKLIAETNVFSAYHSKNFGITFLLFQAVQLAHHLIVILPNWLFSQNRIAFGIGF
jgi:hypothetical protein